jgi:hypothetical protein
MKLRLSERRAAAEAIYMSQIKCPFHVGGIVVYRPTSKGRGAVIMTELADLIPGHAYKIVRIDNEKCLVVEGFENAAGGGVYWKEFSAV